MKLKVFLETVIANVLSIQYLVFFNENQSNKTKEDMIDMEWMQQHMGSRGNYPKYRLSLSDQDNITHTYAIQQMQLVVRHGTRYPVESGMEAIRSVLSKLNQSTAIPWMENYKSEFLFHRAGQLDRNGQQEEYLLGRRLASSYPDFIQSLVDRDTVGQLGVFASWSKRTLQSAEAFCLGAFEGLGALGPSNWLIVPVFSFKENNDSLIAFHKSCPRWQKEAKVLTEQILEPVVSEYLDPIARALNQKLGLTTLDAKAVKGIHEACTSEVAMHHTVDTFCSLLRKEDIIKLEYLDDLKHYYKYSYGLPELNDKMACDLGKHILHNIDALIGGDVTANKLDIKFGHSETLLPLRTLLGLYKDSSLSPNSTDKEIRNRMFKLSNFGYFANNMAIQLLLHKTNRSYHVRILDNQEPVLLPGCDQVVCPIERFRSIMRSVTQCNFIDYCATA